MKKSSKIIVILLVVILSFVLGVVADKMGLIKTNIEVFKNYKYFQYLENLDESSSETYTEYTYPKLVMENEIYSLSYVLKITNSNELMLNNEKVADNVLNMFVVSTGNSGFNTLFFIDKEGNLFSANIEEYLYNSNEELNIESLDYKNIIYVTSGIYSEDGMAGTYLPIFVDIDGNVYMSEE